MVRLIIVLIFNIYSSALVADTILGTPEDDVLVESAGQDVFVGGLGADEFRISIDNIEIDTISDFAPEQGDFVTLTFSDMSLEKWLQRLPKGVGSESFFVDKNGFLKVYLNESNTRTLLNLKKPQVILKVEETDNEIRLYFRSRF
ncbi:calcium-binding protein [Bermanella marisrubri]|uniref:Uncharacterized protein n=1 Tax=Bermanella marisrubri TaxID=207949 RepID=Q1N067_9GAMM|nr:calcium-binding protein [Bermanella marisrubri]EAT11650.1 hypothetical protein RED65_08174 [Oceanobacter sp. RED65] [Bermanella marisrubri]QIZ83309.1 calcium-binding protein [Bermanella marisrubri]